MRALVVRKYGPPKVFELQQMPDALPKPGEVLIRVKTVGVNFADLLQRMGLYPGTPKPPFVPGLEIAGVVEKVVPGKGEGVEVKAGDAVVALTSFHAYAEWVSVPGPYVYPMPRGMSFDDAAAIPLNYLTAYHAMFTMGNLRPGDRILIHGAAGGVGIAAVQLARIHGLTIFGTAGPTKQEYLRRNGVHHAIDHRRSDFAQIVEKYAPGGIEMVMDPVGGKSFAQSYGCLAPGGRLVVYGFSAAAGPDGRRNWLRGLTALAQTPRFHPLDLMRRSTAVIGVNLPQVLGRGNHMRPELSEIFRLYTEDKVKPVIAKTFPLEQGAAAHQYIQDRKNIGKVILAVK